MKLLSERDGLALGICNGFQALIQAGIGTLRGNYGAEAGFSHPDL